MRQRERRKIWRAGCQKTSTEPDGWLRRGRLPKPGTPLTLSAMISASTHRSVRTTERKDGSRDPGPGEASAMTPKITARYARGGRNAQLTAGAASIGRLLLTD
jgi:hypothetical protein